MWQRIGWVATILLISSLAVVYFSTWTKSFNDPDELKAADFIAFFSAGRVAQNHGYAATYDIDLQKTFANDVWGRESDQFLLYNHLPYFVPILTLLVDDNYHASFVRWVLILLFVYLASIIILIRSLYGRQPLITRLILTSGALMFTPLFISLWQGQDTAFLFLGLVVWCVGMLKKNDWLAAAGLALVTVRPHLCIALVLPLLFKYRRVLGRFVVLCFFVGIYSLLLVGVKGIIGFLNLLKISAQGEWFGMNPQNMPNLTGLIYRVFRSIHHDTANLMSWLIFAIGIALIVFIWFRATSIQEPLLGLSILIAAMFAPHLHAHDLTVLILPLLFVIHDPNLNEFPPQAIIFLPIVSFVFLLGLLMGSLYFIVPYMVSAALAWWLIMKLPTINKMLTPPMP